MPLFQSSGVCCCAQGALKNVFSPHVDHPRISFSYLPVRYDTKVALCVCAYSRCLMLSNDYPRLFLVPLVGGRVSSRPVVEMPGISETEWQARIKNGSDSYQAFLLTRESLLWGIVTARAMAHFNASREPPKDFERRPCYASRHASCHSVW